MIINELRFLIGNIRQTLCFFTNNLYLCRMKKMNPHKKHVLDVVKHEKNLSRNDELENSYGWTSKAKIFKNKKKYTRKTKQCLDYL